MRTREVGVETEFWWERLREIYGGKRWIVTSNVLIPAAGIARLLEDLGAQEVLCVAGTRGVGELPMESFSTPPIVLGMGRATTMMEAIRGSLDALADVSGEVRAQIDAFDPEGVARVLGPIFDDGRPLAGRAKFGARPESWQALEDKTVIDALWEEAGVPAAAYALVGARDPGALWEAHERLDQGMGTVWAGDNKEGFHGGGEYLRWVRGAEDGEDAGAFFGAHADVVRVMPFVEGIPCSVHGLVFEEDVVVLRPCEMLVFRRVGSNRLQYGSAATSWDPPPELREELRGCGERVGEHLRERYGYRGAFTLDGVMGEGGFVPTELNPRYGAALGAIEGAVGLPLMLLNLAWVEGVSGEWRARALEEGLLEASDRVRSGRVMAMVSQEIEGSREAWLKWRSGGWEEVGEEEGEVRVMLGPGEQGGVVFGRFKEGGMEVGVSLAPRAIRVLEWVEENWGVKVGELEAARDVHKEHRIT